MTYRIRMEDGLCVDMVDHPATAPGEMATIGVRYFKGHLQKPVAGGEQTTWETISTNLHWFVRR